MFDQITEQMVESLDSENQKKLEFIKNALEKNQVTSPIIVRYFSDIAFFLANESLTSGEVMALAKPLKEIFRRYIESGIVSIDTKNRLKLLIGDTMLDFSYAAGDLGAASSRLAPYLAAKKRL